MYHNVTDLAKLHRLLRTYEEHYVLTKLGSLTLDYRRILFLSAMDLYVHLECNEMQRARAQSERPSEMCFLLRPVSQFDASPIASATQLGAGRSDWSTPPPSIDNRSGGSI